MNLEVVLQERAFKLLFRHVSAWFQSAPVEHMAVLYVVNVPQLEVPLCDISVHGAVGGCEYELNDPSSLDDSRIFRKR